MECRLARARRELSTSCRSLRWWVNVAAHGRHGSSLQGSCLKPKAEDPATSTMHKIWQILLWSFGCLVKGVWPYADWAGRLFTEDYLPEAAKNAGLPLCGGYRFAVWQLSADLDYLSNFLELRHFNSLTPCASHVGVTAALCRGQRWRQMPPGSNAS